MGLDMRGRSTVMKESFRCTRPIAELAYNVLHRLAAEEVNDADFKELRELELVEAGERARIPWWNLRFTQSARTGPDVREVR